MSEISINICVCHVVKLKIDIFQVSTFFRYQIDNENRTIKENFEWGKSYLYSREIWKIDMASSLLGILSSEGRP